MENVAQKTCSRCKITKPTEEFRAQPDHTDGLTSRCKKCVNEVLRERRKQNPEKAHAQDHVAYMRHREKKIEAAKLYYEQNKDRLEVKKKASRRAWRLRNPDKNNAYARDYKKRHPEKSRAYDAKRASIVRSLEVRFTAREWRELCVKFGNRCACCGEIKKLEVDHVVPLSKGGSGDIGNIQPLCKRCNSSKKCESTDYRNVIAGKMGHGF